MTAVIGNPRKNVLVVGMPRSGTSVTASVLAAGGYHLGDRVRQADDANPLGYFQSEELTALNVELFHRVGFGFHNTWLHDEIPPAAVQAIGRLDVLPTHREFVARFEAHAPWVWKDPRLCITLGFWLRVLDPERTCVILVRRDPADIYHSFRVRNWLRDHPLSRANVYRRVDQHIAHARAALEAFGTPHAEIWYHDLLQRPDEVIRHVNTVAGAGLRREHIDARPELDHSAARARLSWHLVRPLSRLHLVVRLAKRVLPERLVHRVFPERRLLARVTSRPSGAHKIS